MQANQQGRIDYDRMQPSKTLRKNVKAFKAFFDKDETVKYRLLAGQTCCLIFMDGMVDSDRINHFIVEPLLQYESGLTAADAIPGIIQIGEMRTAEKYSEAVNAVVQGDTLLLREGMGEMYILSTKGFPVRSISEPDNEKALYGPHEGFTESLLQNTAMLRRKAATSDLKIEFCTVGTRSNSQACICYLESLVNLDILAEMKKRLEALNVGSFMDTYAIGEYIRDHKHSLFNTIGKTERPDAAASKILDGGVVLLLDGSPVALTAPYLCAENFDSQDDTYIGFYYASAARLLRYLAFLLSISVGAMYISLVNYHSEMLPTSFLLTISAANSGLPIPTFMEFLVMMLLFEMLREAGIRMSSKFGQSLSIVGALVIGQAAVEARLISAPMVIIVAVSAITGLMVPSLSAAVIILRMMTAIAASVFGFYGYAFVMLWMLIHLFSLESFGIQYTASMFSFRKRDLENVYLRPPSLKMNFRTKFVARDRRRSR